MSLLRLKAIRARRSAQRATTGGRVTRVLMMLVMLAVMVGVPAGPPAIAAPLAPWQGEYFSSCFCSGGTYGPITGGATPTHTRTDQAINFSWPIGTSPAPGVGQDQFTVRWTKTENFQGGTYLFAAYYDDIIRVYLDNNLVFEKIKDQPIYGPLFYEQAVEITPGNHTLRVEFHEKFADATVIFNYARQEPAGTNIFRVNAGGTNGYADSFGNYWPADNYWVNTPGTSVTGVFNQPVWNTDDDKLYVDTRGGEFTYNVPVANGQYKVRLHFAEVVFNDAGVRLFDVVLEGNKVLEDFDIYAEARKAALVTKTFTTQVNDGNVTILFEKGFDNPTIAAFDIYPASNPADLTAPVIASIPEPENITHPTAPTVTIAASDNDKIRDIYWRIDNGVATTFVSNLNQTSFNQQFTIPADAYDALALGSHVLSFGVTDYNGNASVKTWRFRKLPTAGAIPVSFTVKEILNDTTPGAAEFDNPTTIEMGPDGRLYVGQHDLFHFNGWNGGYIHVLTLDDERNVAQVDRIDSIFNTPNTNTNGSPAIGPDNKPVQGRHVMGLDFDPASTPERPILWVVHSDPRFCFNSTPENCLVNIDSGMITRLIGPDFDNPANRTDFVTGLPRSRENHAPNGLHFGPDGWLYLSIGSNTNYGAPSAAFSQLPETYLTAAILRFNVKGAAASFPMDVRNVTNASGLKPGIFEIFATGYRNAYDFNWHSNGKLYVNVNHGNLGAGPTPGPEHGCPNAISFDPGTSDDFVSLVEQGDYGGHPNPARGECILDDGTKYESAPGGQALPPLPNYRAPMLVYNNGTSSNGITEYRAPTFGGQMLNNLISATFYGNRSVRRVVLSEDGESVLFEEDLAYFKQPLDVATGPDGAIYVLEYGSENDNESGATPPKIFVMEPETPVEGTWDIKAPLPTPTQEVGVVACEGNAYVLGGIVGANVNGVINTNKAWVYSPVTNTWAPIADYPGIALNHVGAACVNGKVYLVGGMNANFEAVNTLYEYDPGTGGWTPKANLPQPRGAAGVAVLNGEIYLAGGIGYPAKTELFAYNPVTNQWRTLASMKVPRDHLIMETVNGRLYAIGGREVTLDTVVNTVEIYDPATNTWSYGSPMPTPRAAMASGVLHGQIQIWGGESTDENTGTSTGTYVQGQMYDPKTDTWTTIADQLTPRHGTDGATIGSVIYVPGGGPNAGTSVTDTNEAFTFVTEDAASSCIVEGSDPTTTDSDGDGFTDRDEIDSGTNPCSPASVPPDADGDGIADINDPDDDNDGIPDAQDQFQLDPNNGLTTQLPWVQNFDPGSSVGGLKGTGFPGYQVTSNGTGFIPTRISVGGAGGYLGMNPTAGTNQAGANSQDNALQVGFDARQTATISTRLAEPFVGQQVSPGKAGGIFFGLDEDNYVKVVVQADQSGTALVFAVETNGQYVETRRINMPLPGPTTLDLFLALDPATNRIVAMYRVDSNDEAAIVPFGSASAAGYPKLAEFFRQGAAAGVITTTGGAGSVFGLAYDYFRIDPSAAPGTVEEHIFMPLVGRP
jgi:N-acetylneuraminic acid mutarotase